MFHACAEACQASEDARHPATHSQVICEQFYSCSLLRLPFVIPRMQFVGCHCALVLLLAKTADRRRHVVALEMCSCASRGANIADIYVSYFGFSIEWVSSLTHTCMVQGLEKLLQFRGPSMRSAWCDAPAKFRYLQRKSALGFCVMQSKTFLRSP